MLLLQAREAAMAKFRPMLRSHGLTEQQWRVIRVLASVDVMDASQLAKASLLLAPSLTRILQHLVKQEFIRRDADATDQRKSVLCLTVKGQQIYAVVGPDSEALYKDIEAKFSTEKLNTLYQLLAELNIALDVPFES